MEGYPSHISLDVFLEYFRIFFFNMEHKQGYGSIWTVSYTRGRGQVEGFFFPFVDKYGYSVVTIEEDTDEEVGLGVGVRETGTRSGGDEGVKLTGGWLEEFSEPYLCQS